jgi:hypothetical protein
VPAKTKKLRYHLLRTLVHPQLYSLVFTVVVIALWVQYRKVVGELKLNPWVAVIFLAMIFRPALVELLRRTEKISTSWAELSTKRLEEDVEKAESAEETNQPQAIPMLVANAHFFTDGELERISRDLRRSAEDTDASESPKDPLDDPFEDPATIREQASYMLKELDDLEQSIYGPKSEYGVFAVSKTLMLQRLQRLVRETEQRVLFSFGPEDGPNEFTPDMAEHLAAWTGVSGWTNVIEVWRSTKEQVFSGAEYSRVELKLLDRLVDHAFGILRKQLRAVAKFGRNE